jgi:plastocyanin
MECTPVVLAGLSTGHMIGLTTVAAVFIAFALLSSFLAPRYRPDFPGKQGLSVFVIACFVLFAAMIAAVEIFGGESETAKAGEAQVTTTQAAPKATFKVVEKEFSITLPPAAQQELAPGTYEFDVHNAGTMPHDLAVQLEGSSKPAKTPLIQPGRNAKLIVTLAKGIYDTFCTVPGHRQAGMETKLTVR